MVPAMAVTIAISILTTSEVELNSMVAMRMPSTAASTVPEVLGETNRLAVIRCMIRPATDSEAPASSTAASRGMREVARMCHSSAVGGKRSATPTLLAAPMPRDR